jgi:hypothetical protein
MRRLIPWMIMALILAACNNVPATVVVLITNTPDPNVIQVTVTPINNTTNAVTESGAQVATTAAPPVVATQSTDQTAPPVISTIARATATPDPNRQPIRTDLYIVQEDFEHGFMFWFSGKNGPTIWVLFRDAQGGNSGEWQAFTDTWQEGQPETDPSIVPPDAAHIQPKRGFGKLWRTEPGLRDALGWASTPEYELTTTYTYQPNGYRNDKGEWIAQPGDHLITSLSRQTFVLTEAPEGQVRGTWKSLP